MPNRRKGHGTFCRLFTYSCSCECDTWGRDSALKVRINTKSPLGGSVLPRCGLVLNTPFHPTIRRQRRDDIEHQEDNLNNAKTSKLHIVGIREMETICSVRGTSNLRRIHKSWRENKQAPFMIVHHMNTLWSAFISWCPPFPLCVQRSYVIVIWMSSSSWTTRLVTITNTNAFSFLTMAPSPSPLPAGERDRWGRYQRCNEINAFVLMQNYTLSLLCQITLSGETLHLCSPFARETGSRPTTDSHGYSKEWRFLLERMRAIAFFPIETLFQKIPAEGFAHNQQMLLGKSKNPDFEDQAY